MATFRLVSMFIATAILVACGEGGSNDGDAASPDRGALGRAVVIERARLQAFMDAAIICYSMMDQAAESQRAASDMQRRGRIRSEGVMLSYVLLTGRLLGMTTPEIERHMEATSLERVDNGPRLDFATMDVERHPACAALRQPLHPEDKIAGEASRR